MTIVAGIVLAGLPFGVAGGGNPHDSSIVYKKMTPEEFAKLPPEEQETPFPRAGLGRCGDRMSHEAAMATGGLHELGPELVRRGAGAVASQALPRSPAGGGDDPR